LWTWHDECPPSRVVMFSPNKLAEGVRVFTRPIFDAHNDTLTLTGPRTVYCVGLSSEQMIACGQVLSTAAWVLKQFWGGDGWVQLGDLALRQLVWC
jgi:hypothetical protein